MEHAVAQLVEAMRYKPEGRQFDSRWFHWNFFYRHNPSGCTMALGGEYQQYFLGVKMAGA